MGVVPRHECGDFVIACSEGHFLHIRLKITAILSPTGNGETKPHQENNLKSEVAGDSNWIKVHLACLLDIRARIIIKCHVHRSTSNDSRLAMKKRKTFRISAFGYHILQVNDVNISVFLYVVAPVEIVKMQ